MKKFKFLLIGFSAFALLFGCKKKEQEPEQYFRYHVNGVKYEYPYKVTDGNIFVSGSRTIAAAFRPGFGYHIYAFEDKNGLDMGWFEFKLSTEFPNQDTIIIDGVNNTVWIENFINFSDHYMHHENLPEGRIIFSERSQSKLKGTFEFEVELYRSGGLGHKIWTDTIVQIAQGEFSIIPIN